MFAFLGAFLVLYSMGPFFLSSIPKEYTGSILSRQVLGGVGGPGLCTLTQATHFPSFLGKNGTREYTFFKCEERVALFSACLQI